LEDEGLLTGAISLAEASADASAEAFAVRQYGQYLGHPMAKYEESLSYLARAVELLGAQGELRQQALYMAKGARCFCARAGRLEEALAYAARARAAGDALADRELQAWRAMEAEVFFYKGCWEDIVRVTNEALPLAQELQEWPVILWSSAWLAIAHLKVRRPTEAREGLDRAFQQAPPRALGINAWALAYPQIAMAEVQLFEGNHDSALNSARQAIESSERTRALLEKGAAYRVLGKVFEATGNREEAEAAFHRSLDVLEGIQSRPELAQTLLAYGRFRRGDNALTDRAMIERALALFEEMGATGWIEEARAALAAG
jgi:tetratricopeptide (TPR) repeat protein